MVTIQLRALDSGDETDTADSESYKELCRNLRHHSKRVDDELNECMKRFKVIRRKVQEESPDLTDVTLQPRPATAKWLESHNLTLTPTFQEFFTAFLREHSDHERLDVSARTVWLHSDALSMFGYNKKQQDPVPILDILARLPEAFY